MTVLYMMDRFLSDSLRFHKSIHILVLNINDLILSRYRGIQQLSFFFSLRVSVQLSNGYAHLDHIRPLKQWHCIGER